MLSCKSKFIASESILNFFRTHRRVWFLTFTEPGRKVGEAFWSKFEAEERFKPFRDYCARHDLDLLVVWERQQRGSWHPHCLVDGFIDVSWCRPWMVARGWGQQMRFEQIIGLGRDRARWNGRYWESDNGADLKSLRVVNYLMKYLTKSQYGVELSVKKKLFGGRMRNRVGTTNFKWMPEEKAGSYLYAMGLSEFEADMERRARFSDMGRVIATGAYVTGWYDIDPLWRFAIPCCAYAPDPPI